MFDLFGAEMPLAVRFFLAFLIVLGLIGATAWAVRRFGGGRLSSTTRGRQPQLAVIDYASVDARRRLILVRRDNVEHLLMIGGPTDVVVEPNIVRATPAARDVPSARPPVAADTLPRVIPLPEAPSNGSWPLQPEPAGPPLPPAPPRRAPRVEPVQEEPRSFPPPPPPEGPASPISARHWRRSRKISQRVQFHRCCRATAPPDRRDHNQMNSVQTCALSRACQRHPPTRRLHRRSIRTSPKWRNVSKRRCASPSPQRHAKLQRRHRLRPQCRLRQWLPTTPPPPPARVRALRSGRSARAVASATTFPTAVAAHRAPG